VTSHGVRARDAVDSPGRRRCLLTGAAALGGMWQAHRANAAPGGLPTNIAHDADSPEWLTLRDKLFSGREMRPGGTGAVQLIVPLRAAYGASVPVKIVSRLPQSGSTWVRRMTLLVDKNPSPVAATLSLTQALGQADFETRLRVNEYSHVRVVSELSDGSLHTDSRYVKVSGGCSAPPNRDRPDLIGHTVLRLPEGLHADAPTPADVTVIHPNDTGFELDQIAVRYIPAFFVRSIEVRQGDAPLFSADMDFSISENPTWRFRFLPQRGAVLTADVLDSHESRFHASLDPWSDSPAGSSATGGAETGTSSGARQPA